jgi:hypothetical protein
MADIPRAGAIRGTTMRWAWTEGPTKGMVHEHVFHEDGTVEWHDAGSAPPKMPSKKVEGAHESTRPERAPYAAFEVTPEVFAVSYLSPSSGFTLTVVLNFATGQLVGVASGGKDWFPLRGTFEVVD